MVSGSLCFRVRVRLASACDIPCDVLLDAARERVADGAVLDGGLQMQSGTAVNVLRHGDVEVHRGELAALFFRLCGDGDAAGVETVFLAGPRHHAEHTGGDGGG